jgi:hypothetical protein
MWIYFERKFVKFFEIQKTEIKYNFLYFKIIRDFPRNNYLSDFNSLKLIYKNIISYL